MDDLHLWFHKTLAGLSRKSDTAAAIRYALSRWALQAAEKPAIGQERLTSGPNARCGEAGRRIFNHLWPD
jgi:hypothetical protein